MRLQNLTSLPLFGVLELKSNLQAEKWRSDRLMETFASASSEFREACALLFGYSLQIRQPGVYKVHLKRDGGAASMSREYVKFKVSKK